MPFGVVVLWVAEEGKGHQGLVVVVVGGLEVPEHPFGRAFVLACVVSIVPQLQSSQMHLSSPCTRIRECSFWLWS